jgi:hypothetical protein
MMKDALYWIVNILNELHIPFQIAGGLAAHAYGAHRPLIDIDIDVPEQSFDRIKNKLKSTIVYGPAIYQSDEWDLMLMTLDYKNQPIDLCGAYQTKIYDKNSQQWVAIPVNFSTTQIKTIFGLDVPVINKSELIYYKKILAREVDIIDINQIS